MLGFINLNKPPGLTSHDCVARVRKILKTKRVGHGGTLDPAATGVLPIAVGSATRLLQFLPENKAYKARIRLGVRTTTDDLEGEVIASVPSPNLSLPEVEVLLPNFIGQLQQIPPAYSAISQGGKRLYELARKGIEVEVAPRSVQVHNIDLLGWYCGDFPEIELAITCGPGTYIRSIARDLGSSLGIGGTLAGLVRTASCGFSLSDSISFAEIDLQSLILPPLALAHLPLVKLSDSQALRWCQGNKISQDTQTNSFTCVFVQVQREGGDFLGIGELQESLLIPKIVTV